MFDCTRCLDSALRVNGSLHKLPLKMICTEGVKANRLLYGYMLAAALELHYSELCQVAACVVKQNV